MLDPLLVILVADGGGVHVGEEPLHERLLRRLALVSRVVAGGRESLKKKIDIKTQIKSKYLLIL
jgi:hypothetical protein